jgi:hypothetical protein
VCQGECVPKLATPRIHIKAANPKLLNWGGVGELAKYCVYFPEETQPDYWVHYGCASIQGLCRSFPAWSYIRFFPDGMVF